MGGKVLMSFLEDYSNLCDQAVIVDVAPKKYPPHHNVIFNALSALALDDIKTRAEADLALKSSIPNTSTRQFLIKSLAHNEFGKFEWQFNLESLIKNYHYLMSYSVNIEPVETDLLFIRGELSDYIEDSDYPKLKGKYPNAKIETIIGASHWVHAEKMAEFLKLVNHFLI
jgi:esterase